MVTACYSIVAFCLASRAVFAARTGGAAAARRYLAECAVLACAAWLGESSCILLYGFYQYDASWGHSLDAVPLAVVLVWPVLIQSARDLAIALTAPGRGKVTVQWGASPAARAAARRDDPPERLRGKFAGPSARKPIAVGLIAGLIVLADAAFIEPIAVRAGLWFWTEPGLFGVPPVGVLGWAIFGGACVVLLELRRSKGFGAVAGAAFLVLPNLVLHAGLLAAWWGAFRWLNAPVPPWVAVPAAWVLSLVLVLFALGSGAGRRVSKVLLAIRIPAALWFAVLLARHAGDAAWLLAWSLAFVPPYLALFPGRISRPAPAAGSPRP